MTWHFTCADRECVAKQTLENGLQIESGGGTYTYLTLPGTSMHTSLCGQ